MRCLKSPLCTRNLPTKQKHCRTVSGGDAFDAVDLVFKSDLVAICPDTSVKADALRIRIGYDEQDEEEGKQQEQQQGSKSRSIGFPTITVETKSMFRIVSLDDMGGGGLEAFEEEGEEDEGRERGSSEEGEKEDDVDPSVWAIVTATYRRTFRWTPQFGGLWSDEGIVFLKVQPR